MYKNGNILCNMVNEQWSCTINNNRLSIQLLVYYLFKCMHLCIVHEFLLPHIFIPIGDITIVISTSIEVLIIVINAKTRVSDYTYTIMCRQHICDN